MAERIRINAVSPGRTQMLGTNGRDGRGSRSRPVVQRSQVIAQPARGYLPIEASIEARATPSELLESIVMCGGVLGLAVSSAPPDARSYHRRGTSDPEGFAAMGVVEVLMHAHDIARRRTLPGSRLMICAAASWIDCFPDGPTGSPAKCCFGPLAETYPRRGRRASRSCRVMCG